MSAGVALWDRFVAAGLRDARALDQGVAALVPMQLELVRDRTDALGQLAFRIGLASLLVGAEDVGRLALAIERTLDLLASHDIDPGVGLPVLTSSTFTLRQSLEQLAAPDRSGARVEGLPLAGARFELETMFPIPGTGRRPTIDGTIAAPPPTRRMSRWPRWCAGPRRRSTRRPRSCPRRSRPRPASPGSRRSTTT